MDWTLPGLDVEVPFDAMELHICSTALMCLVALLFLRWLIFMQDCLSIVHHLVVWKCQVSYPWESRALCLVLCPNGWSGSLTDADCILGMSMMIHYSADGEPLPISACPLKLDSFCAVLALLDEDAAAGCLMLMAWMILRSTASGNVVRLWNSLQVFEVSILSLLKLMLNCYLCRWRLMTLCLAECSGCEDLKPSISSCDDRFPAVSSALSSACSVVEWYMLECTHTGFL
ncbi:hypothetical protein Nepgr_021454 [Nepenthes gracilis]|uniref:Uncharacterized protein n=1 Tax=Nepenthes gracilis TaxID=150966 RepID=A0AAD3SY68_NEPGR|nr:hypothetical protein Nepgr_021454 [Nepenthes gracilis]